MSFLRIPYIKTKAKEIYLCMRCTATVELSVIHLAILINNNTALSVCFSFVKLNFYNWNLTFNLYLAIFPDLMESKASHVH